MCTGRSHQAGLAAAIFIFLLPAARAQFEDTQLGVGQPRIVKVDPPDDQTAGDGYKFTYTAGGDGTFSFNLSGAGKSPIGKDVNATGTLRFDPPNPVKAID